jgi:drug/metabolite transporter (DMT)-like permease
VSARIGSLAILLLTAIIWGFAFVAQVQGMEYIEPFTLIGVRFLIAIIVLLPVVLIFERGRVSREERKRTLIASVASGTMLFIASALQQFGIKITGSAGVSGFITGLYTVFVPIACYLLFKQRTGLNVWLGAVCAVVGLFLLCYKAGEGLSFGVGELLLLIGSFFWTAQVIIIDKLGRSIRSLHFAWGQFAVCALWGLIAMFIFEQPSLGAMMDAKWAILYCGVMSSGVAYTLQIIGQKRADPTLAVIILSTESMFSAIGGVIFGIDKLALLGYVGCALMFAGIVVSQISFKKKGTDIEV